jgi:hypothetical protein
MSGRQQPDRDRDLADRHGANKPAFAGSEAAGPRPAAIMNLLATAKASGHEPQAWLTDVLIRLPTTLDRDIDTLLPHSWQLLA